MTCFCHVLNLQQIFTLPKLADLQFMTGHVKRSIFSFPDPRKISPKLQSLKNSRHILLCGEILTFPSYDLELTLLIHVNLGLYLLIYLFQIQ